MSELRDVFRNAIDLNRYSNSVSRRLIRAYNDIVLDAVDQLRGIDELASPVKAARLRAILAQLNDSLRTWSGESIATMTEELQGLAVLQSEFAAEQLQKALPAGAADDFTIRQAYLLPNRQLEGDWVAGNALKAVTEVDDTSHRRLTCHDCLPQGWTDFHSAHSCRSTSR